MQMTAAPLTNEELVARAQAGDETARDQLVEKNLGLVWKLARQVSSNYNAAEDLAQEGTIGLLNAIPHFDSARGMRFTSYAAACIKSAISTALTRGLTKPARRAFWQIGKAFEMTPESLAKAAGVSDEAAAAALLHYRAARPDTEMSEKSLDEAGGAEEQLAAESERQFTVHRLYFALVRLTEREREIVTILHMADKRPQLDALARHYGISKQRIKQIELVALRKLYVLLTASAVQTP